MLDIPSNLNDGRYLVTDRLGQGGMAVVHKCWDSSLGIWRAVKFLLPALAANPRARQRFQSEAHAMARIEHPNVLRVYDVGQVGDLPFMVAEYAPGGTLENWSAAHGRMPPRMAVEVTRQICRGVGAAHDEGIVHRDIKPDNVLVCRKGTCKVTDFGIAQVVDLESLTRTGSAMGTLAYMAPEQKKDAKNIGRTADIYSIGATLWSLLTGEVPMDLFMSTHDPAVLGDVPEPLRPILLRAVHFRPMERFADTASFAEALTAALPELPVTPPNTPGLVTRPLEALTAPPTQPTLNSQRSRPSEPPSAPSGGGLEPTVFPEEERKAPSAPLPYTMPAPAMKPLTDPSYIDEDAGARQARKEAALRALQELNRKRSGSPVPVPTRPSTRTPAGALPRSTGTPTPARPPGAGPELAARATVTPAPASSRMLGDGGLLEEASKTGLEVFIASVKFAINPMKWAVIPIAGIFVVGGIYLGYSAFQLTEVAGAARAATDGLLADIESESRVIDDLKEVGAQWKIPDGHLAHLRVAPPAERVPLAMEYLQALHEQADRYLENPPPQAAHKAIMAKERLTRLDASVKRYQDAMLAWERAADTQQGRTVCKLGLADCP